jgi:D-glycero-alpha-D-manno-heptose-7-phosphate kinase
MIITRSPLRVSLGGGGTDLPSYYEKYEGFLIAGAINKYVYVNVMKPFQDGIYLKYSELEHVNKPEQIKHKIIRETFLHLELTQPRIELTTLADIPSGTGLGSSGSFTTALIRSLYAFNQKHITQNDIARLACEIEINRLKEPIGKQDQYISAYGGLTAFTFHKNGNVSAKPINLSPECIHELEDNLLLFFTGYSRSASSILKEQNQKSHKNDKFMIDSLHSTKELGYQSQEALESENIELFGKIMHEHWKKKQIRTKAMSNQNISKWYDQAIKNGAIGGKLVGAGGGGFLMFMAHDKSKLRSCMKSNGLEEVRFAFDYQGTKVIFDS